MLDHKPNSTVFQQHYLNKNFSLDVYSIFRGVAAQTALVQKVVSHGGTRSKRRPAKLSPAQSAAVVKSSAKIKRMTKDLQHIPRQHPSYGRASLALKAAKRKVLREAEKKMREEWTSKQAAEDIQRMLDGVPLEKPRSDPDARPMTVPQRRMYEALDAPLVRDYQAHLQRRTNAIRALAQYCRVEDPLITNIMRDREQPAPDEFRIPDRDEQLRLLRQSVIRRTRGQLIVRCFVCVGKALTLPADDPNIPKYCHAYTTPYECTRHFNNQHVAVLLKNPEMEVTCNLCTGVTLKNLMHFQNHSESVHGIKSVALTVSK